MGQDTHALDGIRPRQAVCPACGYVPGGAAISEGVIRCPECGGVIEFKLVKPARANPWIARGLWALTALVLAGVVVAGWAGGGAKTGVGLIVTMGVVLLVMRALRPRAMERSGKDR